LAATDRGGLIRIWDCATRNPRLAPKKHRAGIPSICFDPAHGNHIAVVRANVVTIENVDPGHVPLYRELKGHRSPYVGSIAFDPTGDVLVSHAGKDEVFAWNLDGDSEKPDALPPTGNDLKESATLLISAGEHPVVLCGQAADQMAQWDLESQSQSGARPVTIPNASLAALSSDGLYLAVVESNGNTIVVWDRNAGRRSILLRDPSEAAIYAIAFRPKSTVLAAGDYFGMVHFWDVSTGKALMPLKCGSDRGVKALAFSRDGSRLAAGHGDGTIKFFNADTGEGELCSIRVRSRASLLISRELALHRAAPTAP
jgi:WD40 repeat protein